jgi:hypothetical protein
MFRRRKRNTAIMAALKPPVAEGGPAVHGGGNRRDWFHGVGGIGAAFIAAPRVLKRAISNDSFQPVHIGPERLGHQD